MADDQPLTDHTQRKRTDYTGLMILALVLPVYAFFDLALGREEMGLSVAIILGMIILAVRIRWDLRKHMWFWAIVVVLLLLHVPLLFLVHWPKGWIPAVAMLPIALADLGIILGAVGSVEKLMIKPPVTDDG